MLLRSSLSILGLAVGKTTSIQRKRPTELDLWASADTDGKGVVTLLVSGVVFSLPELYEAGVEADEESEISREALGSWPLERLAPGMDDKDWTGGGTEIWR